MKQCNNCNAQMPDEAKFCGNCGTSLNEEQAERQCERPQVLEQQPVFLQQPTTIIVQQQSNGLGKAGFVFALLGLFFGWVPGIGWILWFLGTVLSFFGLFKAPRGMAFVGLIISFIDIIILLFIIGGIAAFIGDIAAIFI